MPYALRAAMLLVVLVLGSGWLLAPRLVLTPGDHSLRGPAKDPTHTAENVDLAVRGVALGAARWSQAAAR